MIRKIECCKFSVIFLSGLVACLGSFDSRVKMAEEHLTIVGLYVSCPNSISSVPRHTSIPRSVVGPDFSVPNVLCMRTNSEIATPVVQRIVISVIDLDAIRKAQDEMVHGDYLGDSSDGAPSASIISAIVIGSAPVPLHQPIVVGCIHNCDLSLRERYIPA
jgi:hypothetical protein